MKLRNKKTGKICELGSIREYWREEEDGGVGYRLVTSLVDDGEEFIYNSLAEIMEEWEDYKPVEPLIKDEKVRKAVRAWAEVNEIGGCVCKEEMHCITFETERGMFISFENADPIPPEGNFTIAELCGEEEKCES